jgi:hypothetical protein
MNPYTMLAALVALLVAVGGAYVKGRADGSDHEIARLARDDDIEQRATVAAADAAASAIAGMQVKQVTIRQEMQREVRTNTVFRDCRSGDGPVRLLNDTIGAPAPPASAARAGELPASGASR